MFKYIAIAALFFAACGPNPADVVTTCDIPPFKSVQFEYEEDCERMEKQFQLARDLLTGKYNSAYPDFLPQRTIIPTEDYDRTFSEVVVYYKKPTRIYVWFTKVLGYCDVFTDTVWLSEDSVALPHELRHQYEDTHGIGVMTATHPGWDEDRMDSIEAAYESWRNAI